MPIILSTPEPQPLATVQGMTLVTAHLHSAHRLSAAMRGSTAVSPGISGGNPLFTFAGRTGVSANLTSGRALSATVAGSTTVRAQTAVTNFDPYQLTVVVDILPAGLTPNSRWLARLLVDGDEVPVVSGTYSELADTSGGELQVTLARLADKALMVPGASVDFGFGRKAAGVWVESDFIHKISDGQVVGTVHTVGAEQTRWTDTFTIRTRSNLQNKLDLAPVRDTVFYDSGVQTLSASDFEPLLDTEGREYNTELRPIAGMMLYDIFREILVEEMGFTRYQTNLPNYRLVRVECGIGQPYIAAIRGYFGLFNPVIYEWNDDIWVIDTSLALPSGFPALREINLQRYKTLAVNETRQSLDGYLVQYVENGRGYDYVTIKNESVTVPAGDAGEGSYTETTIERSYREYRKFAQPAVVIKSELFKEWRDTDNQDGELIKRVRENRLFNEQNQMYRRDLDQWDLMPDVEAAGAMTLMKTAEERETWSFKVHPYQRRKQYMERHELNTLGLQIVDADQQQLGQDFVQGYEIAYRSGNLREGQTTQFTKLWTRFETYLPLPGSVVRVQEFSVYHPTSSMPLTGTPKDVPGDVAISAMAPQQKRVLVLATGVATPSGQRILTVHGGEVPVTFLVPLFRRKLVTAQSRGRELEGSLVGYDEGIRKGMPVAVSGRTPSGGSLEDLGSYIILGYAVQFNSEGTSTTVTCRELDETGPYIFGAGNPAGSYTFSMVAGAAATMTVQVECLAGYSFRCTAVSNVAVEARAVGDVGWTNIETTPIDLGPYDGTTQGFEVRVTAGAGPDSRAFTLWVEHD